MAGLLPLLANESDKIKHATASLLQSVVFAPLACIQQRSSNLRRSSMLQLPPELHAAYRLPAWAQMMAAQPASCMTPCLPHHQLVMHILDQRRLIAATEKQSDPAVDLHICAPRGEFQSSMLCKIHYIAFITRTFMHHYDRCMNVRDRKRMPCSVPPSCPEVMSMLAHRHSQKEACQSMHQ